MVGGPERASLFEDSQELLGVMKITGALNEFLNPSDISERRGKFKVSSELLDTSFHTMVMIMHNVVVIRAEHDLASGMIEYTALSPHFEAVSLYSETPEYEAVISSVGNELADVKWAKVGLESDKPNFMAVKSTPIYPIVKGTLELLKSDPIPKASLDDLGIATEQGGGISYEAIPSGKIENLYEKENPPWAMPTVEQKEFDEKFGTMIKTAMQHSTKIEDGMVDAFGKDVAVDWAKEKIKGGTKSDIVNAPKKAVEGSPVPVTFVEVDQPFVGDGSEPKAGSDHPDVADDEIPF